ncbi:LysR family transcriptional regulator [Sphingomonas parva]|uniref:LysR family transcriptional regulator n=1 Tax=Sphingomonas parva TaxID=2555898 RepID=A0A4Y8ZWG7_9SPHN|nr:LysR family transcriptional regulator [Sphingomonas parva]TFI60264.1 LysR family transcriptional regulator [Sphingomonas parva]
MHRRLAWDDLLYVLSVGRTGSLSGAARTLRVNHSTVFRRIAAIEEQLGVRLFDRRRDGYAPTAAGEEVIALAGRLDDDVIALERRLAGEDLRPSGTVRFTTTDTMISTVIPICADFRRAYPEICVELVTGNEFLNLTRRDADVALRPSAKPPETLHGRRLATIAFAVYGAPSYLAATGGPDLDRTHQFCGLDDSLSHLGAYRWIADNVPRERIGFRASSFVALVDAARVGLGLAVLPCYLGEESGLQRVGAPLAEVSTDLWLLVHEDLRRTARVRVFLDFVSEAIGRSRAMIEAR